MVVLLLQGEARKGQELKSHVKSEVMIKHM